jgi:two-component system, NtrC family, response regulator HydG
MSTTRHRVLIVEDEAIVREDLRDMLLAVGYDVVGTAMSGPEAISRAEELLPDLVLMDIRLRGSMDGIEAACRIRQVHRIPVIFLTAFADDPTIQRAKAAAPYGYLTKPLNERALRAAIEVALNRHSNDLPPASPSGSTHLPDHGITGNSEGIQVLRDQIARLGPIDINVLIEGETGSGKELAARALHRASRRAAGPFLAVNCAALTETLASTELFGHRRGAFTGAVEAHKGIFESAAGGTVFLDEIGDIPKSQQPYLLRVLEQRTITRVGESVARPIDVRILTATHQDLDGAVADGRFRADLLYRIRVGRIRVPSLRERTGDIPILANAFIDAFARQLGRTLPPMADQTLEALVAHPWPGNVRELRNAVEFAALRCEGNRIEPEDLPPEIRIGPPRPGTLDTSTADPREALQQALQRAGGNRSEAARFMGVSRATFYRRLADAGLDT